MNYVKIDWLHSSSEYPVVLYSELDQQRWEVRKVEVFGDGRFGFASAQGHSGGTRLGKEPLPPLEQISLDPEFEVALISKHEFEEVWSKASEHH